jgi:hypothetical protein
LSNEILEAIPVLSTSSNMQNLRKKRGKNQVFMPREELAIRT